MKHLVSLLIISILLMSPTQALAQVVDNHESDTGSEVGISLTEDQQNKATWDEYLNSIGSEIQKEQSEFGYVDEEGNYTPGSFRALKLKPSDKKRLTKLANGSLTEKEKERTLYDQRLLQLLQQLVTPVNLGGAGLTHLRVGDLLRFRQDPRSKETENTDNISAHQFGRAADITEINTAYCTVDGGLLGEDKDLPPFPVKVAWQGGGPYNPSLTALGSFDAVARNNAFRDIIGAIPGATYNGSNQGLEDLLQQMQRRVLAIESDLPPNSLDFPTNNDVLETLGRAIINKNLSYPAGALDDGTLGSIPRAYLEDSLTLPAGSLKSGSDGSWSSALETLGRTVAAMNANVDPQEVLKGQVAKLKSSYYSYYKNVEKAYGLPAGTYNGITSNQPGAFRQIGAAVMADRLNYSDSEKQALLVQAQAGTVQQFSLARATKEFNVPFPILPLLAPTAGTTKSQAEAQLGTFIQKSVSSKTLKDLPEEIQSAIRKNLPILSNVNSREDLTKFLVNKQDRSNLYRLAGAKQMETIFDLPAESFSALLAKNGQPSKEDFITILGQRVLENEAGVKVGEFANRVQLYQSPTALAQLEKSLNVPAGSISQNRNNPAKLKTLVGQRYIDTDFQDSFNDMYHTSRLGLAGLTFADQFDILLGKINQASTRAGASWVEEDLGLAPDSFASFFAEASAEDRLVSAGINVIAGELFTAFDVDAKNIQSGEDVKLVLGRAKIETALGLEEGTFRNSISSIKEANADRYALIFTDENADNQSKKAATIDAILGVANGTTSQLLSGSLAPDALAKQVGERNLLILDTEDLQNKLGWDDRFKVDGKELLAAINGTSYTPPSEKKQGFDLGSIFGGSKSYVPNVREVLAKIGGYNSDYALGYDPGTMDKWIKAGSEEEKNRILLNQGSKLYSQRLGLDLEDKDALLKSYKDGTLTQEVISAFEKRLKDIGPGIKIPSKDILSIVNGDMPGTQGTVVATAQSAQSQLKLDNKYEIFRTIIRGSSSDPNFEAGLSQQSLERYQRVLKDYNILKDDSLLDRTLETITKGTFSKTGDFNPNASPYSNDILSTIEKSYFGNKEARNDYFYGLLDQKISEKNTNLPKDFSETLMEGSMEDRSKMVFTYLGTKLGDGILQTLPSEIQGVAQAFLTTLDPAQGKVLSLNDTFNTWASDALSKYMDNAIPPAIVQTALKYISGGLDGNVIAENPEMLLGLNPTSLATGLINNQLGLPIGQFQAIYQKYQAVSSIVKSFNAGTLDPVQAAIQIDMVLFDGAITGAIESFGQSLGLPPGFTLGIIIFAATGNPVYLIQSIVGAIFGSLFGGEVHCPDLQQEAKKNIKKLMTGILDIAEENRTLQPSQIITFNRSDFFNSLRSKIDNLYKMCEGTRCGIFTRPEYASHVHIGF